MPIRTTADTELGLLLMVFEGVVTVEELERSVLPLIDQPGYALMPAMIIDMSKAEHGDAPSELIRSQARRVGESIDQKIAPGAKMALVATSPEFYGLSRMYQTLRSGSPVEVEIFGSRSEAEVWLALPEDYAARLKDVPA